jgi:hypothetical protein
VGEEDCHCRVAVSIEPLCPDVRFGPILLQKDFCPWNEERFSRTTAEWRILIHGIAHLDSIIAEFPWSGSLTGTFATISAQATPGAPQRNVRYRGADSTDRRNTLPC